MFIILFSAFKFESINSVFTDLKIFLLLILLIDLLNKILLKGSPSSTIKEFLITFSSVIKLPKIFILSTYDFLSSSK